MTRFSSSWLFTGCSDSTDAGGRLATEPPAMLGSASAVQVFPVLLKLKEQPWNFSRASGASSVEPSSPLLGYRGHPERGFAPVPALRSVLEMRIIGEEEECISNAS